MKSFQCRTVSDHSGTAVSRLGWFATTMGRLVLVLLTCLPFVSAIGASSIDGPGAVCPGTTNLFSVITDSTNGIYAWTIGPNNSAGSVILGDTNTAAVSVLATGNGGFTLNCLVNFGQTNELATTAVLAPLATLSCPTNLFLQCPADMPAPDTNQVKATNAVAVLHLGDAAATNGSVITVIRTYAAVNTCGQTSTCAQVITVRDTTPPLLTCPSDLLVSETRRDSVTVTFPLPAVADNCDPAPKLYSSPASGSLFPIGDTPVTWTAVDASGNSNFCVFYVSVVPARLFFVTNAKDSGSGSLRDALLKAGRGKEKNLIRFALPVGSPNTIRLLSPLPEITNPTIIDGWSQGGSNRPPAVALDGGSNSFDGLVIRSGPSRVRGLAFYGFATGIRILEAGTNVIEGTYLGVDLTGTKAPGNKGDGIYLDSPGNLIGGTDVGTGNLIAGNAGNGLTLTTNASRNLVQGNYIGLGADGRTPLGNGGHGLFLTNHLAFNTIGGTLSNAANTIKFNGANGVTLDRSVGSGNAVLENSIDHNHGLGIDLGNDGITPNDTGDTDTGPNELQNFPTISDARCMEGMTTIDGTLAGEPGSSYRVEFFLVNEPTNHPGSLFLGATQVKVKSDAAEAFSFQLPITLVYTQYVAATATDPFGNTSEFSPAVQIRTPPVIEAQPVSATSTSGGSVTFCAGAYGTPPILYQWRLNGVNLPGATNSCYTIPATSVGKGGTYTVIVGNVLNAYATIPATLQLTDTNILRLGVADHFADAIDLSSYGYGTNGILAGDNSQATFEAPVEPQHVGRPGGRSVWYRWCAPQGSKGIATFRTSGSTFDTLLAVYQGVMPGTSLSNLVAIADDEDDGGFYSSEVRFNAYYNTNPRTCYYIAVDGLGGTGGPFLLSWTLEKNSHLLPLILQQPASLTVPLGASIIFTNFAIPGCADGNLNCILDPSTNQTEKLTYQWYFNDAPIPNQTSSSLLISNVQPGHVGNYRVRVFSPWQYLDSKTATLQINNTGEGSENIQAFDKFEYLDFFGNPLLLGLPDLNRAAAAKGEPPLTTATSTTVVRGYSGTQIFDTTGSASTPGEVICGVTGGASEWISIVAEANGTLFLNTDGSSYDTVIAVFRRNPTNAAALDLLACDNNGGSDGADSSLNLPVQAGTTNYVLVDGVNGAAGTLQLNYSLATSTILKILSRPAPGATVIQVNGRPALNFSLQYSTNLANWMTLVTTNAPSGVFNYTDTTDTPLTRRYYRALILP